MITPEMRIGFGTLPILLSGLFFGPRVGALTGIAADLVGVMINPFGATIHLGFTFSSMLAGFIPGFVHFNIFKNEKKHVNKSIFISILLVFMGVHLGLNSLWLSQLYGNSIFVLIPLRFVKIAIEAILTGLLIFVIYKRVISYIEK